MSVGLAFKAQRFLRLIRGYMQITSARSSQEQKVHEEVLVVPRDLLFAREGARQGFFVANCDWYAQTIMRHKQFLPRSLVETDENFKQIIPYIVVMYRENIFVVQRRSSASEQRLARLLSVGIGGHIRASDVSGSDIFSWAAREWREEICYEGDCQTAFLGFINDDSNPVGRVHFGVVYLIMLESSMITVRSELKTGVLTPLRAIAQTSSFEPWSRLVLEHLLHLKFPEAV